MAELDSRGETIGHPHQRPDRFGRGVGSPGQPGVDPSAGRAQGEAVIAPGPDGQPVERPIDPRRLADHRGVRGQAGRGKDMGQAESSARLLVGAEEEDKLAACRQTLLLECRRRVEHRRQGALHVGRAEAMEQASVNGGDERIALPICPVTGWFRVRVTVQDQPATGRSPDESDQQVRAIRTGGQHLAGRQAQLTRCRHQRRDDRSFAMVGREGRDGDEGRRELHDGRIRSGESLEQPLVPIVHGGPAQPAVPASATPERERS